MINKVMLLGRLGADPVIRYASNGDAIANLSLATTDRWTKNGEKQEKTEWHKVVLFGKLAEIAQNHLKKGKQVYVEGKIQTRKWDDQNGNTNYSTEIVLSGFNSVLQMIGDDKPKNEPVQQAIEPVHKTVAPVATDDFEDEDIPF